MATKKQPTKTIDEWVKEQVAKAPPLTSEQISKLRLLLGIDQIDVRPKTHKVEKPKPTEAEVDLMIAALPRMPGPNAKDWGIDEEAQEMKVRTYHSECLHCGQEFTGKHPKAKYCSKNCRNSAWWHRNKQKRRPTPVLYHVPQSASQTDEHARARLLLLRQNSL